MYIRHPLALLALAAGTALLALASPSSAAATAAPHRHFLRDGNIVNIVHTDALLFSHCLNCLRTPAISRAVIQKDVTQGPSSYVWDKWKIKYDKRHNRVALFTQEGRQYLRHNSKRWFNAKGSPTDPDQPGAWMAVEATPGSGDDDGGDDDDDKDAAQSGVPSDAWWTPEWNRSGEVSFRVYTPPHSSSTGVSAARIARTYLAKCTKCYTEYNRGDYAPLHLFIEAALYSPPKGDKFFKIVSADSSSRDQDEDGGGGGGGGDDDEPEHHDDE